MRLVQSIDEPRAQRKSSITQYSGMLAVRRGDEWVPIAYDVLDGIVCNTVKSHKAVLTAKPHIGYHFPVKECRYLSEAYVSSHQEGKELALLPEWYGAGFYEKNYDRDILVNSDSGALGEVNDITLRVGLDYVLAKHVIPGEDS